MSDPPKRSFVTEHGKEMNLYPDEMSLVDGMQSTIQLLDGKSMLFHSKKPLTIIAKYDVKFLAPNMKAQTNDDELVMVISNIVGQHATSSSAMSHRFDFLSGNITAVEGYNCIAYQNINEPLPEASSDIPWAVVIGAVVGSIALVALAACIAPYAIPVIACAGVGALASGATNIISQVVFEGKSISQIDIKSAILAACTGGVSAAFAVVPSSTAVQVAINMGLGGLQAYLSGGSSIDVIKGLAIGGFGGFLGGPGHKPTLHFWDVLYTTDAIQAIGKGVGISNGLTFIDSALSCLFEWATQGQSTTQPSQSETGGNEGDLGQHCVYSV